MIALPAKLTRKEIQALEWSIDQAATWRGTLELNARPEFDEAIALARAALTKVKHNNQAIKS